MSLRTLARPPSSLLGASISIRWDKFEAETRSAAELIFAMGFVAGAIPAYRALHLSIVDALRRT